MSINEESGAAGDGGLIVWDPERYLRIVDSAEVKFSRGFLRSQPERWFPGFAALWLPLAHSLGVDLKVVEVKPVMSAPVDPGVGFVASIDDEPLAVYLDRDSSTTLMETVIPGGSSEARTVVSEYFARRFVTSLGRSWSGPESSVVRFEPEMTPDSVRHAAAVKFVFTINGQVCTAWLMAGKILVDRMDGLWRRQLHSAVKEGDVGGTFHLEVAHLTVPPSMLSDYVKSGTTIDLEVVISDQITLVYNSSPWMPARMCSIDGSIGFEITSGALRQVEVPEGTTRLSIEFGSIELDSQQVSELSQIGAIWNSQIALGQPVEMRVNEELVARATLSTYEGRFAISVL